MASKRIDVLVYSGTIIMPVPFFLKISPDSFKQGMAQLLNPSVIAFTVFGVCFHPIMQYSTSRERPSSISLGQPLVPYWLCLEEQIWVTVVL